MAIPKISIKMNSGPVTVQTIYTGGKKSVSTQDISNIKWRSAILFVNDDIPNGPTRDVVIEFAQDREYTFLKTHEWLPKTEFENIFGFKSGQFIKGRIIKLKSQHINIDL